MWPRLPSDDLHHTLEQTRELWDELRAGRLFITGGTGFFGCWLLETFCHANARLALRARAVVLTRHAAAFHKKMPHLARHPDLEYHEGDVRDFRFPDGTFTHVIHAGTTSGAPVPPAAMFDTIVTGTRRVLEFAQARGVGKLLFTSSGAVYGTQPPDLPHVAEDFRGAPDPCEPASAYGEGKRAAELLCALAHQTHGLAPKIARCFAFVGPHLPLDAHFAAGNFIRDALNGGPIVVKDGAPFRSYLYAADLAVWLWTILFKGVPVRPYNVGSEDACRVGALARDIAAMTGVAVQGAVESGNGLAPRYVPSTARARSELGLRAWTGRREAIAKTIAWHQARLLC